MVKSTPRIPNRSLRKMKRFLDHQHRHHRHNNHTLHPNPNPSPPNPLKHTSPSPSTSCGSSLLTRSLSGSGSNPDPRNPISSIIHNNEMSQLLPPLPPLPSHNLLRRSISDPVPFGSFTPPRNSLSGSGSGLVGERRPSSKRLRRTIKKKGENCFFKDEEKKEKRERAVRAERLGGDWIMIIINCPCGSDYKLLISEVDNKCYYKLM